MTMQSDCNAAALVAMGLAQSLFTILRAKKILNDAEVNEILEMVLAGLENIRPANDPGVRQARKLAESIGRVAAEKRRKRPR